jgi:hypothetical protein
LKLSALGKPGCAKVPYRTAARGRSRRLRNWAAKMRVIAENSPATAGGESVMARCETCGNDYDKAFQVTMSGSTHTFDSFECAIHALAPTCENCGIRIVGHGLEKDGTFFCCEHCAEVVGVTGLRDRIRATA